jgi:hypothetical protein
MGMHFVGRKPVQELPESGYECGKYHIRSASVEYREHSSAAVEDLTGYGRPAFIKTKR